MGRPLESVGIRTILTEKTPAAAAASEHDGPKDLLAFLFTLAAHVTQELLQVNLARLRA